MLMKKLNIGLIGYGFMGRAHSNAYLSVGQFFDIKYQPVLKAVAEKFNLQPLQTDWTLRALPVAAPETISSAPFISP